MFDLEATIKWTTSVITDPHNVASNYKETAATWQRSFMQLVLPLYVAAFAASMIVSFVTGGSSLYGLMPFSFLLMTLIWSIGWTFVIAFLFDYLAGVFADKRNFDGAYAVVALAIVPSALGTAIAPLPWIGWLISLAAGIYSLVLAYRFVPIFLEIPEETRVKHFVVSVVIALVVSIVLSTAMSSVMGPAMLSDFTDEQIVDPRNNSGVLGGFSRQAEFVEGAAADSYEPRSDGEISRGQMERYVDVIRKTKMLRERLGESLQSMEDKEPSLSDIFSGVSNVARLSTSEMEVVKTAGGNWAEHQWVKGQIETARVQQDLNSTTQHNYDLFLKYEEQITAFD